MAEAELSPRKEETRRGRGMIATAGALCTIALAVWGGIVWDDFLTTRADTEKGLLSVVRLLEAHTRRTIDLSDQVVRRVADRAEERGLDAASHSRADWQEMREVVASLPELDSVMLLDADGHALLSSHSFPSPRNSMADREFMALHRAGERAVIGGVSRGRSTPQFHFTYSRRIEDGRGSMLGVALAAIDLGHLTEFYRGLDLGKQSSIAVFRDDGTVIARWPQAEPGQKFPNAEVLRKAALAPEGVFGTVSIVDGTDLISAYRNISALPLVVQVSRSSGEVFAEWRRFTAISGAVTLLGCVLLMGIASMAANSQRREDQVKQALIRANIDLQFMNERSRTANERSRALGNHLSSILASAGEGICGLDKDGRITFANPAACRMLGWAEGELLGSDMHALVHHARYDGDTHAPGDCPILRVALTNEPCRAEDDLFWHREGYPVPVTYTASPMEDGRGAVIVFEDVSDRKAIVEELQRSNHDLETFAHVVSHDLQEPLRMVSSYMSLLKRRHGDRLDAEADEFIAFAVDGANRMSRMIGDLLDFARVTTRGGPLTECSARAAVESALGNLSMAAEESGARIHVAPLPPVMADPSQLASLFQNLVGNAIKYAFPGRPLEISIQASARGETVEFRVADNGRGMASRDLERAFVMFTRLESDPAIPGNGVGLTICKRIVQRHGGRIWVVSEPEVGTTFFFTLLAPGTTRATAHASWSGTG